MGTTADKLNGLKNTKQAIKQAIIDKGVAVDEAATFASYATKIGEIQAGDPGTPQAPKITCWDTKKEGKFIDQIKSIDWTEYNKFGVTSMGYMFDDWPGNTLDIANLSTKGVTSMQGMFYNCRELTSLDVSHFDTSQCEGSFAFQSTFMYCYKLTTLIGLTNWDISKGTNLSKMFNECNELLSLDLSSWNTSNIENMKDMLAGCKKLSTVIFGENWGSNPSLMEFETRTGPYYSKGGSSISKESILDLFNKLATRDNAPVINIKATVYDSFTPDELTIAQNKGWTVTRA